MFGVGIPEIIVILTIALIVIGPDKLPDLAKTLGKALSEFKKVIDGVKESIDDEQVEIEENLDTKKSESSLSEKEKKLEKDYEDAVEDK